MALLWSEGEARVMKHYILGDVAEMPLILGIWNGWFCLRAWVRVKQSGLVFNYPGWNQYTPQTLQLTVSFLNLWFPGPSLIYSNVEQNSFVNIAIGAAGKKQGSAAKSDAY